MAMNSSPCRRHCGYCRVCAPSNFVSLQYLPSPQCESGSQSLSKRANDKTKKTKQNKKVSAQRGEKGMLRSLPALLCPGPVLGMAGSD